ncbi:MAG: DUF6644 family protein [Hyphomicrobiaceae bacterium]
MNADAPAILIALEQSGFAMALRQSVWAYPTANVAHIVTLVVFAAAVAVMDLRLLGAFSATEPAKVVIPAQRVAIAALALQAASGLMLFAAEASHVSLNPVFLTKAGLIALGIVNALAVQGAMTRALASTPASAPLPARVRVAAVASMVVWLSVAAAGRLIAYF